MAAGDPVIFISFLSVAKIRSSCRESILQAQTEGPSNERQPHHKTRGKQDGIRCVEQNAHYQNPLTHLTPLARELSRVPPDQLHHPQPLPGVPPSGGIRPRKSGHHQAGGDQPN
jgi:hypothetical protein